MTLEQAMQARTAELRHHQLQGIEAVIERKHGVDTKTDAGSFFFG